MGSSEHVRVLRKGPQAWNKWRQLNRGSKVGLRDADLSYANLERCNLPGADLRGVNLRGANLFQANLSQARFEGADLTKTIFCETNLRHTDLSGLDLAWLDFRGADLYKASLIRADLRGASFHTANLQFAKLDRANLTRAELSYSKLHGTRLSGTNFKEVTMCGTALVDLDLSTVRGLNSIHHDGPSSLSVDTIVQSRTPLPEVFLRGCGLPDVFVDYVHSLTAQPIQYYSCFISHSAKDKEFAQRLHNDLQAEGVRCWFAPEDIRGGKKLHEQIEEAIRIYDKLLLILSPNSISSEWVRTEIAKAQKRELTQKQKMLFPVRLIEFETLRNWECLDSDSGKDIAREIREYYIPDFSRWKVDNDAYPREFVKLLRDLKGEAKNGGGAKGIPRP